MYIVKNALRNISRSKGRNVLIGIIILVIVISATISLSIRQAAEQAKEDGLAKLNVTGNITIDRDKMMKSSGSSGSIDKSTFKKNMQQASSLSLTELQKYAKASSVKSFYYTLSSSVNGSGIDPVESNMPTGGPGMSDSSSADFTLVGYSSDDAMTSFTEGNSKISSGKMFTEGTSENVCVISKELAKYNSLKVGDTIKIVNPDNKKKTVKLKITGIYTTTSSSSSSQTGGMQGAMGGDTANQILTSYAAAKSINSTLSVDGSTQGTYTFASVSNYNKFENQAHDLGLASKYTVESTDINQFEQSLQPLQNLSKYALWFLIIVLAIGIVILIVINLFSVRERKYEIGVLSAMGMSKGKVAWQFICETLALTIVAIIIGTSAGAAASVPITNALLANSTTTSSDSFDRGGGPGGGGAPGDSSQQSTSDSSSSSSSSSSASSSDNSSSSSSGSTAQKAPGSRGPVSNYISSVSSATNFTVVLQILGIGLVLSVVASGVAINYVMRFDPLRILTNRD